jgi:hypothetical protein
MMWAHKSICAFLLVESFGSCDAVVKKLRSRQVESKVESNVVTKVPKENNAPEKSPGDREMDEGMATKAKLMDFVELFKEVSLLFF